MRRPRGLHCVRAFVFGCLGVVLVLVPRAGHADVVVQFQTQLLSLDLTGGPFAMPLASDPGNALGDSVDGFGFVNTNVSIMLSSQRALNPGPASLGMAIATPGIGEASSPGPPGPIDPNALHGQSFLVQSFFDVYFDVTLTDVDIRSGRDFATGTQTITLQDLGPGQMETNYTAIFDKDAPNFGLVPPPESAPYIGHFDIVIDLSAVFGMPVDINMNGDPDVLKFTLASHAAGDENRSFISLPDGTVIDSFDSTASLAGAIQDQSTDPPFSWSSMSGPTSASSRLLNPLQVVPEPSTLVLASLGALAALGSCWRGRKRAA